MRAEGSLFGEKVNCDFIVEDLTNGCLIDMLDMMRPVVEENYAPIAASCIPGYLPMA